MIGRDFPLEDKLVIAVGDSFFDKKYYKRIYGANSDMYFWPEYLSPTVFCDGKAGCGNQSIFERALDDGIVKRHLNWNFIITMLIYLSVLMTGAWALWRHL